MTDQPSSALDLDETSLDPARDATGDICCAFSTTEVSKVGTGTTTRKHIAKLLWYVEQVDDQEYSVRQINVHNVPTGDPEFITLGELMTKYVPEVEFYEDKIVPAMDTLEDHLDEGETDYEEGKLYSAEGHFNKALGMDERNVRALFNLGLIYLDLKDADKARDMMEDILNIKTAFDGKNQHLFNSFGIALRKAGMFAEAALYYENALKFVKNDENLFYNLARVHYEQCDYEKSVDALEKLFAINPKLEIGHELVSIILTLANNRKLALKNGKEEVPSGIPRRITAIFNDYPEVKPSKLKVSASLIRFNAGGSTATGRARSGYSEGDGSSSLSFDMD